jgi:hypothetical protein
MPYPQLNRDELSIRSLAARANKLQIDKMHMDLRTIPEPLPAAGQAILEETVERIRRARAAGRPVMLTFGAHTIKNGLAPVLIRLIEKGWVTHLATNGAGIIYCHPMNFGAAVGRTAERDFLAFAQSVRGLEGGVYLSVGSAVMSPMVFEKSLSMAQNLEIQAGRRIEKHFMVVVDLADAPWDWAKDGEPPMDNPAYYLRYCKTFSRMGGTMRYLSADNRQFLLSLLRQLERGDASS